MNKCLSIIGIPFFIFYLPSALLVAFLEEHLGFTRNQITIGLFALYFTTWCLGTMGTLYLI